MRLADYIAHWVADHGSRHVFLVTGGGAMHLNDAFGRCAGLQYVCCHHEQAAAMAAEAYARISGELPILNVTTGPGGINSLNGVFGAWVDSIPMLIISGQVRRETTLYKNGLLGKLRQLGDQEADIVGMVEGITKYAVTVDQPSTIRYHLERARHLATSGRPGPCWIDVPVDVQGAEIDPDQLVGYDPAEDEICWETRDLSAACEQALSRVRAAERPIIYAGSGVRLSGCYDEFLALIETLAIPVVTAWNSNDLLWNDHPLFVGRPGIIGDRPGNFAVQNSDCLLMLGTRLNIRQVSYNWKCFARGAYKIAVDIDAEEMRKPTCDIDLPIHADLRSFLPLMQFKAEEGAAASHDKWLGWCKQRQQKYPVVLPEYWSEAENVNPYCFMDALFQQLGEGEIVATGDGTACVAAFQAAYIRCGQRLFHNSGCASMGYDLPAAIGCAFARPRQRIICIAGDGSIMMNLQELQTIVGNRLPIKIFVLNNRGYHSIRQTQRGFFPDNVVGCGTESGLSFPDFNKLAVAFGIPYNRCSNHDELGSQIAEPLSVEGPAICEVVLDLKQGFAPRASSRRLASGEIVTAPMEDMAPFLSREEMRENMIVPMVDDIDPAPPRSTTTLSPAGAR
jgi:acetolactate synthase I/II/III large subunit